jgi:hypothetical protein
MYFGSVAQGKKMFGSISKGKGSFGTIAKRGLSRSLNTIADIGDVVGMVKPEVGMVANVARRVAKAVDPGQKASQFEKA